MKYGRFIVPAALVIAFLVLSFVGAALLDSFADLGLRLFLIFALSAWWAAHRSRRQSLPETASITGIAIDARQLISGIAEARESIEARRPRPANVLHYRKTLLIQAHEAVAEAGYFKHREPPPEAEHAAGLSLRGC